MDSLEAILDDYLISRSIDDVDLEQRILALLAAERERAAQIAEEGVLQIGCTADEAVGVVRRARDAIAAAIRALD